MRIKKGLSIPPRLLEDCINCAVQINTVKDLETIISLCPNAKWSTGTSLLNETSKQYMPYYLVILGHGMFSGREDTRHPILDINEFIKLD